MQRLTTSRLDARPYSCPGFARSPRLGPDLTSELTGDFDATMLQVYGTGKQGARFGYTHVRGYHPLLATLAGTGEVLHLRAPTNWPWHEAFQAAIVRIAAIPAPT